MNPAPAIAKLYERTMLTTANHSTVIALLHHRCVQHIQLSLGSPAPRRRHLNAAQNILAQFERSLDLATETARNLILLYDYCYCQLESDSPDSHRNAIAILTRIRDAFDVLLHR
jgi:flagellin-specific chaperone FliS